MYKLIFCAALCCTLSLSVAAQNFEKFPANGYYGHFVYTPPAYETNTNQVFPLLIAYHGVGEGGNGSSSDLERLKSTGIPKLISQNQWPEDRPFIVLCPQSTKGFMNPNTFRKTLDRVLRDYRVDEDRIYLTGYSAGAMAMWIDFNNVYKDIVAAAVPVAGNGVSAYDICEIKDIPIWAFHGASDSNGPTPPDATVANIQRINACTPPPAQKAKVTIFPGVGHNSWDITYNLSGMNRATEYDDYDMDIYTWMLQYSRKGSGSGVSVSSFNASPATFFNNKPQSIRFTANVSGSSISGVTLDLTTIGGPANQKMVNSGGRYEFTYEVAAGLSVGNKYISVTAKDNAGNESGKSLMLLVEEDNSIESPANLETSPVNTGEIKLNWIDRSDNETGFVVEYRKSNESAYKVLGSVTQNTTTYSATGLECGVTFFFRVKAVNDNNSSDYTNAASASPLNLAAPEITIDGELNFCEGQNVVLASGPDYEEYLWSNGAKTKSITASASGNYSLKVKDRNNCWSPNSEIVRVAANPLPSKPEIVINGSGMICPGTTIILEAPEGHDEYLWSNGAATQTIQVDEPGKFTVAVADKGCWSEESDEAVVAKSEVSKPVITYNGPNEFCEGASTLLETPAGYNYYLWSDGRTSRSIEVEESGSYSVQVAHCPDEWSEASEAVSLTFHDLPDEPVVVAQGDTEFCEGESLSLTISDGYAQYEWRNHASTTHEAEITNSGEYAARVKNAEGCWSTYSNVVAVTVHIKPEKPEITYEGTPVICPGQNFELAAPAGHDEYLWSNGATTQTIQADEPGEFTVAVADNGCWSEESDKVAVLDKSDVSKPAISYSGPNEFCEGASTLLETPAGYNYYLWSDGRTSRSIEVEESGSYSVQVAHCPDEWSEASEAVSLTFHDLPDEPVVVAQGDTEFCEGESLSLTISDGYAQYEWRNHASTTHEAEITNSGEYAARVKNAEGCWSTYSNVVAVTVHIKPEKPEITYEGTPVICPGQNFELTAPAGHDEYLWSNGATTQTIQADRPGEFTVAVADNGCWSEESDKVAVLDKSDVSKPAISYNGPNEFCEGVSTLLETPAGYNYYLWSDGRTSRSIEVEESGSYSVQVAHCPDEWSEASEAVSLTFHDLPDEPVVVAQGDTEFCEGESLSLTISDGYAQYEWRNHASTTHEAEITNSGEYAARVKNAEGCWSTYSNVVAVTVHVKPEKPEITHAGTPVICPGQGFELSAPEGYDEYLWSNGSASRTINAVEQGDYFVSVANNGCWSETSEPASVAEQSDPEKPALNYTGDREFCSGETAALSAPAQYNYYLWSDGSRDRNLEVSQTGTYSVQVANCPNEWSESSDEISLLFHELPVKPVVNASGETEICEGEHVSLTADAGYAEYNWQNHSSSTETAVVSESGNYSVRVKNEGGCWSGYSDIVSVTVHATPVQPEVAYEGEPVICPGQGFSLTASGGTYEDFVWSNGATTQTIVVTRPGQYAVKAANNGCWSVESAPAVIDDKSETPKPVVTYDGQTTFCGGKSVLLAAPAGYNYYSWTDGSTQNAVQINQSGIYSVRVAYCPGEWSEPSEGIQITVNPVPETPVIHTEGSDYCIGETAALSVPATFEAYLWSNGSNSAAIAVEKPGNYAVRVKNQYNCWSDYSDPVKIAFREMATPTIVINDDTDLCEGDKLTLKTAGVYNKYLWSNGETQPSIAVEAEGTYSVQVSNCHSGVWSDPSEVVEVNVHEIDEPVIWMEENVLSTTGYEAYQWLYNGTPILGATNSYYAPSKTGDYTVQVFNEYGCSEIANILKYTYEDQDIVVYPNPSSGRFILKLLNPELREGSIIINSIENKNLAYVKQFIRTPDGSIEFDLSGFDTGFYILILKSNDRTIQSKLVIH